ncbi:MAG TPA: hypothetical protein VGU73_09255, partial [Acidimicrobiia bacterium]|nr:hypothetical protein [Acidimicrobiia bacterium]
MSADNISPISTSDVMRWLAEATGATMQYSADAGLSTYVSGGPGGGAPAQGGGAPGQSIPGSSMSATSA